MLALRYSLPSFSRARVALRTRALAALLSTLSMSFSIAAICSLIFAIIASIVLWFKGFRCCKGKDNGFLVTSDTVFASIGLKVNSFTMKPKKKMKKLPITEADFMLANRRAARLEEIAEHGRPVSFRKATHKSKKVYDRKRLKKAGIGSDDLPLKSKCEDYFVN